MKVNLLMVAFILSVFLFNFISAEMLTNEANVSYDSRILDAFNSGEAQVNVIIYLKDASKIAELSSNLSEAEFRFVSESPDIIAAEITQSGFEKLLNNQNINEIHFNSIGSVQTNESKKEQKNKIYIISGIVSLIILFIIFYIIFKKKR